MSFKLFISFLFIVIISANSMAADIITQDEAHNIAQNWVNIKNNTEFDLIVNYENSKVLNNYNIIVAYLFEIFPQGFITISSSKVKNPVIAYSFINDFISENPEEKAIALNMMRMMGNNDILNSKSGNSQTINREISNTNFEVGPFVMSLWGQVNCYDNNGTLINVSNYYTPSHYAPGCVAVSMATLIHHYTWPVNGTGSHTYTDSWGSSKGTYSADFENTYYGWNNMLTRYKNKPSTDWQREAEGELVYQTAVSLNMDFEHNGSTSNVNRIPNAGYKYFRYSSQHRSESSSVFWQLLDTNMFEETPVVLSVSGNGYGHSVVCDGLRIESDSTFYYHLNMGWWGSSNGWYRIRDEFNAGGYSVITGGVFNFVPIPALSTPVVAETDDVVTLNWQYAPNFEADAYEIQQKIDNGNWETITDDIQDTTFDISIDPSLTYVFRVKAKYNNKWSFNSWSNEAQMGYVGINDNNKIDDITFGPVPAKNNFTIYFPADYSSVNIDIYNSIGRRIKSLKRQAGIKETSISTINWNPGMYFIKLSEGNKFRVINVVKN